MRYELEEVYHQKDFRCQELDSKRKINRISQNRQIEELEKGYDIINQEKYEDDQI